MPRRQPPKKETEPPKLAGQLMPDFMRESASQGLEKFGPEEIGWSELTTQSLTEEQAKQYYNSLLSPEAALREILSAVLSWQTGGDLKARETRLQFAMKALLPPDTRLGRPKDFDDDLVLLEMARLYVKSSAERHSKDFSRAEICREALSAFKAGQSNWPQEYRENKVKHLTSRFNSEFDKLMIAVTAHQRRRASIHRKHVTQILESLKALGLIKP